MLKPMLLSTMIASILGASSSHADQAAAQMQQTPAGAIPAWIEARRAELGTQRRTVPAEPAWVTEHRANMSVPAAPARPLPPQAPRHSQTIERPMAPQMPAAPEPPLHTKRPAAPPAPTQLLPPGRPVEPQIPAASARADWVETTAQDAPAAVPQPGIPVATAPNRRLAPLPVMPPPIYRAPVYPAWNTVPYRSWGTPYHGGWGYPRGGWGNNWFPFGNGWGNNGWNNGGLPFGGWGNNGWNNSHQDTYSNGYGRTWGDSVGSGDAAGDMDFSFNISGRANADMRGHGAGDGWGGTRGYGYNANAHGSYYPMRPSMPLHVPAEAAPEAPDDGDRDGIADSVDLCPDTAAGAAVDVLGCDQAARIVLRGVNFKTDSDELTPESLAILDGVSATLSGNPDIKVMVAGHTDSDGDEAYNKDLSQRRAQAVVDYLGDNGVDAANLVAKGYGEEQPVAGNDTAEGKAQNRRVELNRL